VFFAFVVYPFGYALWMARKPSLYFELSADAPFAILILQLYENLMPFELDEAARTVGINWLVNPFIIALLGRLLIGWIFPLVAAAGSRLKTEFGSTERAAHQPTNGAGGAEEFAT
jgi:ABC-type maltose transport system permease subunit